MTEKTNSEPRMDWQIGADHLADTEGAQDCIECRTGIDGTLDFGPLPLAMKNIWLFNNGGEKNDVY